jgi:hypothetical protein
MNGVRSSGLGRWRSVVERAFAWLHNFRRLRIRWERDPIIHISFLTLACAVILLALPQGVLKPVLKRRRSSSKLPSAGRRLNTDHAALDCPHPAATNLSRRELVESSLRTREAGVRPSDTECTRRPAHELEMQ